MKLAAAAKAESKLNDHEKRVLAMARAGRRTHDMDGWTFRLGHQGVAGRRALQVRPWNHDTWFFVAWCTDQTAIQTAIGAGFLSIAESAPG